MRRAIFIAAVLWAAQFPGMAAADLYRWVDPESGSVKFSSYPPPWYREDAQPRRMPKVERIPARSEVPARREEPARERDGKARTPGASPEPSRTLEGLNERRKALLAAFESMQKPEDFSRAGPGIRQQLEAYQAVTVEMDRLDPQGAEQRKAAAQPVIERLAEGLRAQFSPTSSVRDR